MGLLSWLFETLYDFHVDSSPQNATSSLPASTSSSATTKLAYDRATERASIDELLAILEEHHAKPANPNLEALLNGSGAGAAATGATSAPPPGVSWTYLFVTFVACAYALHLNYPRFFPATGGLVLRIVKGLTIHPIQNHALGLRGGAGDTTIAILLGIFQFLLGGLEITLKVLAVCCRQPLKIFRSCAGFGTIIISAIGACYRPIHRAISLWYDSANHSHEANLVRQQLRRLRALLSKAIFYAAIILFILHLLHTMGFSLRWTTNEIDEYEEILPYEVPNWVIRALPENRNPYKSSCHYRPEPRDVVVHIPGLSF